MTSARPTPLPYEHLLRRKVLGILVFLGVLLLVGHGAGYFLETYYDPLYVASRHTEYLLYQSTSAVGREDVFVLHAGKLGGPLDPPVEFSGNVQGAVAREDRLTVFFPEYAASYHGTVRTETFRVAPVPWTVLGACPPVPTDGRAGPPALSESRLRSGQLEGWESTPEREAASVEDDAAADAILIGTSDAGGLELARWFAKCRRHRFESLEILPGKLNVEKIPERIQAVARGEKLWLVWKEISSEPRRAFLFWVEARLEEGRTVWGSVASEPLAPSSVFAAAAGPGGPRLFLWDRQGIVKGVLRLAVRDYAEGRWGAPEYVEFQDDGMISRRVYGIAVASIAEGYRIALSRFARISIGSWNPEAPSPERPVLTATSAVSALRKSALWLWLLAILSGSIACVSLGVSLFREKTRPRPIRTAVENCSAVSYASWMQRAVAYAIDVLVLLPFGLLMSWIVGLDPAKMDPYLVVQDWRTLSVEIAFQILLIAYFAWCEVRGGQSLGKRLVGIMVVRTDHERPHLWQAVLRNVLRLLDGWGFFWFVGLIFLFCTRRAQRLGDLAAHTVVIVKPVPQLEELPVQEQGERKADP